jgi:tripartite-type tricarboxylate transporter receptor subunit TctC
MSRIATRLFVFLLFAATAMAAAAADFPSRPVRLVVPFPPGGALDVVARLIAAKLPDNWHQPVIVENRAGAVGTIGVDYVAKSPPDGHAMVITAWSLIVATPQIQRTPYDFARDLVAVVQTADLTYVLAASQKSGLSSIGDLVALARKNPGRLNYASPGNGSGQHLYAELVKRAANIEVTHVPYKGEGPSLQALLTGEVDLFFGTTGSLNPFVKADKVRALLVTGTKPLEGFSMVPPMDTVYPGMGMGMTGWHGIFAPAATPKAIVDQIASSVRAAVLSPELSSRFREMGFEATGIPSERFGEIVLRDYARWGQLVRENNIRAD